jgi:hypothetical protein
LNWQALSENLQRSLSSVLPFCAMVLDIQVSFDTGSLSNICVLSGIPEPQV